MGRRNRNTTKGPFHLMDQGPTAELVRNLPDGWWKNPELALNLAHWFQRHLLGLQVVIRDRRSGSELMELYTGFIVEHRGVPTWFTAGHNLLQIRELLSNKECSVIAARWCDNHPGLAEVRSIPIDLEGLPMKHLLEHVADVGFAWPASELEAEAWKANPDYHPLTSETWMNIENAHPEGYYVVGYPSQSRVELRSETVTEKELTFRVNPVCVPIVELLEPNPSREPNTFWAKEHCLFGRVELGSTGLTSIKGLSGGPVLSIERTPEGGLKYRLYGIQSSWLPDSKIVRVEPIGLFVHVLDEILDEFEEYQELKIARRGIE
jgi:hypothetical protein